MISQKKQKEVKESLKNIEEEVNPVIEDLLTSYVERRSEKIVKYQINTGGKRLRPALSVITSQMMGGEKKDIIYPAAGLEIIHNYTLIIDDMIDNGELRRGMPTSWKKFGLSIAQCIGVHYTGSIIESISKCKHPKKVSKIFSKTIKSIADGEIQDILFEQSGKEDEPFVVENRCRNITRYKCLKMIKSKTAVFLQNCCELGGVCADAGSEEIKKLKDFGLNLGIIFQIKDDLLDIFGKEKKFGKKIGKDIKERKLGNIVILFALQKLENKDKEKFHNILEKEKITEKDLEEAIKLINKTNAKERATSLGENYLEKSIDILKNLPQNKWNQQLKNISYFVLEREK